VTAALRAVGVAWPGEHGRPWILAVSCELSAVSSLSRLVGLRQGLANSLAPLGRRPRGGLARAARLARLAAGGAVLIAAGCRAPEPPTMAQAATTHGDAGTLAQAYLRVAMSGREEEHRRAALLWGLYACDVPSPIAALRAFSLAMPEGGLASLATRRLEEALSNGPAAPELWLAAGDAPWIAADPRARFRVRGSELFLLRGSEEDAVRALPALDSLKGAEQGRALAVLAATRAGAATAGRQLAIEHPRQFVASHSDQELVALQRTFTAAEWGRHAEALLLAGDAEASLRAARRSGQAAALTGARAALRLRRGREALGWAERLGSGSVDGAVERAEALRQIAWAGPKEDRQQGFGRVLSAAERARRLAGSDAGATQRADLLLAEAFAELGRFAEAQAPIARSFDRSQPRWEWVWRRLVFRSAQRRQATTVAAARPAASTRVQRTVAFWSAQQAARAGDAEALRALAASGLPDLPGLWAARELRQRGVTVTLTGDAVTTQDPPAWAADLITAGRVSDVVVAWRAELEARGDSGPGWLGLLRLASMPALDAIPLLLRGEPRLLSGPWSGLPRVLLAQYLPLPLRDELEAAAQRGGVPPWLLAGLVRHESAWTPRARSVAGAVGLAQIMPATGMEKARVLGLRLSSSADLSEPANNLLLGAALLTDWRRAFGGSWTAGLAAYNGGERRARTVWELARHSDGPEFVEALEIPETWDYVHRVVLLAEGYRLLYWPDGSPYPWT
jgi:soluble lytic murein transglycosylase-like protein